MPASLTAIACCCFEPTGLPLQSGHSSHQLHVIEHKLKHAVRHVLQATIMFHLFLLKSSGYSGKPRVMP